MQGVKIMLVSNMDIDIYLMTELVRYVLKTLIQYNSAIICRNIDTLN